MPRRAIHTVLAGPGAALTIPRPTPPPAAAVANGIPARLDLRVLVVRRRLRWPAMRSRLTREGCPTSASTSVTPRAGPDADPAGTGCRRHLREVLRVVL